MVSASSARYENFIQFCTDLLRDTVNDGTNIDVFSYFHKL